MFTGVLAGSCFRSPKPKLQRNRHERGVTLVEVVVVIVIVSLILSLLLPATQRVREAMRRSQCLYHLKQLATAAHGFHSQHETLPYENAAGFQGLRQWNPGNISAWGQLLPFVDQQSLYSAIDFSESGAGVLSSPPYSDQNVTLLKISVSLFKCPADSIVGGAASYRTCQGTSSLYAPISPPTITWGRPGASYSLGIDRRTAPLALVTDGLSNSVLYSEKIVGDRDPSMYHPVRDTLHAVPAVNAFDEPDWVVEICRNVPTSAQPLHASFGGSTWLFCGYSNTWYNHILTPNSQTPDCTNGGPPIYVEAATTARSWHTGGVNVAMADGAARFVSENVDLKVWRAVGTRAGNETVGEW